ncbi:glutathione S-transferase [[Pantoea] beijingensis]|uniref:Glutathione S-transferase n=1 Tax=[Pantoea] beijingensis TaxID=1324864 RepID=A0A443IGT0_9GAMM|nr:MULTISPECIES: glutathione S-transferase [Erwiniaceae]RWR03287.1 glutathione S-transferase [[Pantoea] beijingensis]
MKLIGNYTSPFARKISVIMLEKGITFEFVNESPWHEESPVPQYNPLGKVPALVVNDDQTWFDSAIIAEYLDSLDIAPALIPRDTLQSLRVRQIEVLADGVCDAALVIVRHQMLPPAQQSTNELLRQREKIRRGLDALEHEAAKSEWLNGTHITLADIATACAIGYLNFRHVAPNWCVGRPTLVKLVEKMFQRESFARTVPPTA